MLKPQRASRLAATVTCTALLLAACGDDSNTTAVPDETPAASGQASTGFCDASLAIEQAPEPEIDFESATEADIVAAVQGFGAEVMRPLADEIVAAAPAAIDAEVEMLSAAIDDLAAGNLEAMDSPDVQAASDTFDAFVDDECGWTSLAVSATDYTFTGIPDAIDAGPTRFRLTNDGQEAHEVLVFRRNTGTDQSIEELLSLSDAEALDLVTPVGNPAFATPGGRESVVFDLTPGSYIALCLIPTGLVDENSVPATVAPPHAAHGMTAEFTVS
jgi:hypothetical protein